MPPFTRSQQLPSTPASGRNPQLARLIKSTPIAQKAAGSNPYRTEPLKHERNKRNMARETSGYWVGPCPTSEFLDEFLELPAPTVKTPLTPPDVPSTYFKDREVKCEKDMYRHLRELFNGETKYARLAPGYVMVDTSNHPDPNSKPGSKIKPDLNVYPEGAKRNHPNDMSLAALSWELKPRCIDIAALIRDLLKDSDAPFEHAGEENSLIRGQLATYATEVCARQHRTHLFMVYVFHPYVRLLRWDRSGIVVSDRFDVCEDCSPLIQFLWRFALLGREAQGYDPTVTLANKKETSHAHKHLTRWEPQGVERSVFKMDVPHGNKTRQFLVWGAVAEPESPLGRATRGYPALEATGGKLSKTPVFLKEQWRSMLVTPEAETLRELKKKKVKNAPTLVCGGDVEHPNSRRRIETVTQELADEDWRIVREADKEKGETDADVRKLDTRILVRIVTEEVGNALDTFSSSFQMLNAIHDAFLAHQDALDKCGFLHRDISAGNILILDNGNGLLIDWDLMRKLAELADGARASERTGTWPFMSIAVLRNTKKIHAIRDDLESFFWVALYYVLLYVPHTHTATLPEIIKVIFHYHDFAGPGGTARGGTNKLGLLDGELIGPDTIFSFTNCPPLLPFIYSMMRRIRVWYSNDRDRIETWTLEHPGERIPPSIAAPLDKVHADIKDVWKKALEASNWPPDDKAVCQLPGKAATGSRSSAKRAPPDESPDEPAGPADPDIRSSKKIKTSRSTRR